jgi:hypothetical protein
MPVADGVDKSLNLEQPGKCRASGAGRMLELPGRYQ